MKFDVLKRISEIPGTSGFESPIRELIQEELKNYPVDISRDNMGNLLVFLKGKSDKRIMLGAHMDEIGFLVNHIDENGFLRFVTLGGFDPKTLTAQRVIVHGKKDVVGVMGSKPIHMMSAEERKKPVEIEDFFIDTGMDKKEVEKYVSPGDPVTRERECIEMGDCINGKSLDNRVSVFILIECIKQLAGKELPHNVYAVFTVQEEVGIRGAQVACLSVEPDIGIGLDTTIAYDVPGAKPQEQVTALGRGAAIKIMDASAISDSRMVHFLKQTAEKHNIKWQPEIMSKGGTDTALIQRMRKGGAITGAISVPTRHIHQVVESVHKKDVEAVTKLLVFSLQETDQFDWNNK